MPSNTAEHSGVSTPNGWDELLSSDQVKAILGVSSQTISNLVADKELRAVRIGRLLKFRPADVEEFMRQSFTKPVDEPTLDAEMVLYVLPVRGKAGVPLFSVPIAETALRSVIGVDIDWGDGSPADHGALLGNRIIGSHTYAQAGRYEVELSVSAEGLDIRTTVPAEILG